MLNVWKEDGRAVYTEKGKDGTLGYGQRGFAVIGACQVLDAMGIIKDSSPVLRRWCTNEDLGDSQMKQLV